MSLVQALLYAQQIIASYELDIRQALAEGTVPAGFCQGVIYREALADIARRAGPLPEVEVK